LNPIKKYFSFDMMQFKQEEKE